MKCNAHESGSLECKSPPIVEDTSFAIASICQLARSCYLARFANERMPRAGRSAFHIL